MSKELIDKLSNLKMTEKLLRRTLDTSCYTSEKKRKVFKELEDVQKQIELVKFKLKLEKEIKKNEKSWKEI